VSFKPGAGQGIIAIAVAFWAFVNRCQAPLVAYAILLFIVIDYSTFDQLLNPYRTWHYSLFFFVLSSILVIDEDSWRRYFVCGLASFLLFQYEYIFALFLFIACSFVILTGKESLAHKKRLALSFSVGAAASILIFLAQLLAFFGSGHKLIAEVLDTWQARNILWLGRPNLDYPPITTSDLIKIFSWTPAVQFRLPSGFLEYVRYTLAAFYANYKFPIAMLFVWPMLIGIGIAFCRLLGVVNSPVNLRSLVTRFFYLPIPRMTLGCLIGILTIGLVAPGYSSVMYLLVRLPMINLTVFLIMTSLIILAMELTRNFADTIKQDARAHKGVLLFIRDKLGFFSASVPIFAAAVVLLNTNVALVVNRPPAEEFYLLEKHAVRGIPIATNAEWPATGIIHGITGRQPLYVTSAETIPASQGRPFELFLCSTWTPQRGLSHDSDVKCNINKYSGGYIILGGDARFILVKLN
jgi:hypothetical protein